MYKICIPSFDREKIISKKTLALLEKHIINRNDIFIFVQKDELEKYKQELPNYNIIEGGVGIHNQRMAISNFASENEIIVSLDDDITDIFENGVSLSNLHYFIIDTINFLHANHLTLAGIYPINNPFYTKNTITLDNRFLIGQFKIFVNKRLAEKREYQLLEDYENTIKHYKYSGGVLRFNYITLKANYKTLKGGLKEYRTLEKKVDEVQRFVKQYPNYAKSKKQGLEIALIKNPKT